VLAGCDDPGDCLPQVRPDSLRPFLGRHRPAAPHGWAGWVSAISARLRILTAPVLMVVMIGLNVGRDIHAPYCGGELVERF
jgi:hypothetical protein